MASNSRTTAALLPLALALAGCGTYYEGDTYVPQGNGAWKTQNEYSVHDCGKGTLSVANIYTKLERSEAIFGVPMPFQSEDASNGLWLISRDGALRSEECDLSLLWVVAGGEPLMPTNVRERKILKGPGSGLYCTYHFPVSLAESTHIEINFNSALTNCHVSSLSMVKAKLKGYRNVPFQ